MRFHFNHTEHFAGQAIRTFDPNEGLIGPEHEGCALRILEHSDSSIYEIEELFYALLDDPRVSALKTLVIGPCSRHALEDLMRELCDNRGCLTNLNALFVGDFDERNSQITWIELFDISPLLQAFPRLEVFQIRGCGERPRYDEMAIRMGPLHHEHLRALTIQTGGLSRTFIHELSAAYIPRLEHLELWLGDENQGGDTTAEDLAPILAGDLFPNLKHLGLKNSSAQDNIIAAVLGTPTLKQITSLDVSMGNISEMGVRHLLLDPDIANLSQLDVSWSYLPNSAVQSLQALPCEVITEPRRDRDDGRYCAVGE